MANACYHLYLGRASPHASSKDRSVVRVYPKDHNVLPRHVSEKENPEPKLNVIKREEAAGRRGAHTSGCL